MNDKWKSDVVSIAIGILVLILSTFFLIKTEQAKIWPTASGKIIASEVVNQEDRKGNPYSAKIQFAYNVNGRDYVSDKISFGEFGYRDAQYSQMMVNKYSLNQKVNVYYSPQNPEEGVLEFNEAGIYFFMAGGAIFFLAGLFIRFRNRQ